MVKSNLAKYEIARRLVADSRWTVDATRGVVIGSRGTVLGRRDVSGYLRTGAVDTNRRTVTLLVHRVIWEAAHGPIVDENLTINHINGDKSDNRLANLELVTHAENIAHAHRIGIAGSASGETNGASRLTSAEVEEIRARLDVGETGQALAAEFGVAKSTISRIRNHVSWAA